MRLRRRVRSASIARRRVPSWRAAADANSPRGCRADDRPPGDRRCRSLSSPRERAKPIGDDAPRSAIFLHDAPENADATIAVATRLFRISAANIGPNRFHQNRTVSWLISIPRSAKRSSTLRSDSGDFTYIITTRRITAGELLKYRNGSRMGREIALTMSFRDYPPALGGCPACQWTATNI
jgi:hypothetical protein